MKKLGQHQRVPLPFFEKKKTQCLKRKCLIEREKIIKNVEANIFFLKIYSKTTKRVPLTMVKPTLTLGRPMVKNPSCADAAKYFNHG